MAEYEHKRLPLPHLASAGYARDVLGIVAEYGDWELKRHVVWQDGRRSVEVRRRVQPGLPPLTA
jgi:hypothetical protein